MDLCEVTGHPKYLQHQPQESYATNFLKPREKYVLIQMESKLCCIVLLLRAYIFYVNVRETDQVFAEKELVVFVLVICYLKLLLLLVKLETVGNLPYCQNWMFYSVMEHLWIIIGIPVNKWFEFSLSSEFLCGSANCVICIPDKVNTYISRHLEFILKKV